MATACGGTRNVENGGATTPSTATSTSSAGKSPGKPSAFIHVTLEFSATKNDPPTTKIDLVETNEVGGNERHNLGEFDGQCKDVTDAVHKTDPEVFLAFHCQPYGKQRGALVHIMNRRGRLVILRAWLGASKPAFDDFDQIGALPPSDTGIPLTTDYD